MSKGHVMAWFRAHQQRVWRTCPSCSLGREHHGMLAPIPAHSFGSSPNLTIGARCFLLESPPPTLLLLRPKYSLELVVIQALYSSSFNNLTKLGLSFPVVIEVIP